MASRKACDPRLWSTFWSTIDQDDNRYRHQLKQDKNTGQWQVRTEIWEDGSPLYHSALINVSESVGKYLFQFRHTWTNVGELGRPLYPPEFAGGFLNAEVPVGS